MSHSHMMSHAHGFHHHHHHHHPHHYRGYFSPASSRGFLGLGLGALFGAALAGSEDWFGRGGMLLSLITSFIGLSLLLSGVGFLAGLIMLTAGIAGCLLTSAYCSRWTTLQAVPALSSTAQIYTSNVSSNYIPTATPIAVPVAQPAIQYAIPVGNPAPTASQGVALVSAADPLPLRPQLVGY